MFSKCAAIVLAAMLQVSAVQAGAFDPSAYYGEKAFEILVTGDVTPILQADTETRNQITLYAMSVAGKLQYLWKDDLPQVFGDRALLKVMLVSQVVELDAKEQNNLLSLGALDATAFAAHHDFGSQPAQTLLANLTLLMDL